LCCFVASATATTPIVVGDALVLLLLLPMLVMMLATSNACVSAATFAYVYKVDAGPVSLQLLLLMLLGRGGG